MSQRSNSFAAAFAVLLTAGGLPLSARAGIDPALFQDLHWRSIGPFRGGRVLAVAGAPDVARRFYFGAVNGGVWKTDDAGRTWTPIFDSEPVGSIGALAVAPSAPDTLYVGTGEADMRSDIAQGVGMFKSTDAGASWRQIGLKDSQSIGKILVDPRDPNVVLVAALGHPYGPNPERGVFRSTDGGATWTRTLFKNADTGAVDLAFEPGNPNVVYAALWQTRRPPWNVYPPSNGPGGGLWKSLDGGKTWSQLSRGLPAQTGRIGIAVSPSDPKRVYALIDAAEGGLYRSDDAGGSWRRVGVDRRIWQRGWYFSGVTVDPKNADRIWVCDTIVLQSDDGGATFTPKKGDPTGDDFHALWIDPTNSDRRILGVDQGTLVTLNGGETWSSWFNQPTGQFYHVATDNRFPYMVYGAQQDSGAAGVPSRGDAAVDGINMTQFHEITAGGESDEIAPDPNDPDTVYGGRVDKLDRRSGQTRSIDPTLAFPADYRGTWTLPLKFGKGGRDLLFANQRIFRTSDGGEHWTPISPDLTRKTLTVPATLDAPTAADTAEAGPRRGVVYDIGPSPLVDGLIWAGTDDGLVWRTEDGGGYWVDVTPKGLAPWSKIGTVEPSHFDTETAYIAVDRHRLDDFAPYVLRSHDGGRTWTPIAAGLAEGGTLNAVNVVREDPVRRGLLYAGTERGAFVSFDDGDHWQPLQNGLPRTSVRDITIHDKDLVIATHGRGFYIMEDIVPLRALAENAAGGPRLLPLAPAVRLHAPPFTGTPMPRDEPLAPNPPDGAYIDYIVEPGAKSVQIAILDGRGAPVARFSNTDPVTKPDLAKIDATPEWFPIKAPPSAAAGQHRFIWDLRYPLPAALAGGRRGGSGVWAPPGLYTVELNVDGQIQRQPLEVVPDPRVKLSPAAFQAEFALAREIEQAEVQAQTALAEAGEARTALEAKLKLADAASRPRIDAELAAVEALAASPAEKPSGADSNPPPGGFHEIYGRLGKLAEAVDGADAAPSPDDLDGFRQARAALDADLLKWKALKAEVGG
jgi:photosystem II stability/assembly factor-like uncharacterized protein